MRNIAAADTVVADLTEVGASAVVEAVVSMAVEGFTAAAVRVEEVVSTVVEVVFAAEVVSTMVEVVFVVEMVFTMVVVFTETQVYVAEQLIAVHSVQDQAWLIVALYGVV
jgi:hypothetical protein